MAFVATGAGLLTVLNLSWIVRQLHDFRPPRRKAQPAAVVVEPRPVPLDVLPNGDQAAAPTEAVTEPGAVQRARGEGPR
jgi:hypothetical protein